MGYYLYPQMWTFWPSHCHVLETYTILFPFLALPQLPGALSCAPQLRQAGLGPGTPRSPAPPLHVARAAQQGGRNHLVRKSLCERVLPEGVNKPQRRRHMEAHTQISWARQPCAPISFLSLTMGLWPWQRPSPPFSQLWKGRGKT